MLDDAPPDALPTTPVNVALSKIRDLAEANVSYTEFKDGIAEILKGWKE